MPTFYFSIDFVGGISCITTHHNAKNELLSNKFPGARFKKLDENV